MENSQSGLNPETPVDLEAGNNKNVAGSAEVEDFEQGLRVIQIYVEGEELKNMDEGRDKSDTQIVLKMKWKADQVDWTEVDHTEVVHDNLNPRYEHHFDVVYNFG